MKRQRSYGDGLDDDRRRFYDRGPPPPPPPPRRPLREYEGGDRFVRRKGFGGGGSYDSRYRDYPSPREYGGDRALHRSESFSGFRREFPKGFRSDRDRQRRDGECSSAWRRPGAGWRDEEGLGEHRALPPTRLSVGASLPAPPRRSRSRSRSPIELRRRLEAAKADKVRKQSSSINEMEEGEVAPDAEQKTRPAAVEHRKQVEPSRAKEKGRERSEVNKMESGVSVDSGTQRTGASHPSNAGSEEGNRRDGLGAEAGKAMDKGCEKPALKVEEEGEERHELKSQNVAASDAAKFGLSTSSMQQEVLQERVEPHEQATNSFNTCEQGASFCILSEVIQEETTTQAKTTHDTDVIGRSDLSSLRQGVTQVEATVLHKTGCAADEDEKGASSIVRQEHSLVSNETGVGVVEVEKSVSSDMAEEVLKQVKQCDGTVNAVNSVESTPRMLEAMQGRMPVPDEITNTVDNLEPVSYSGLLKRAMHDENFTVAGTTSSPGVVGQFNSSDMAEDVMHEKAAPPGGTNVVDVAEENNISTSSNMAEDVMHEKAAALGVTNAIDVAEESNISIGQPREMVASLQQQDLEDRELETLTVAEEKMSGPTEYVASDMAGQFNSSDMVEGVMHEKTVVLGVTNANDVAKESNVSTGPPREVVACLHQQALQNKELENVIVIEEKLSEPTECAASRTVEGGAEMDHSEKIGAPMESTLAEGETVMHDDVEKQVKIFNVEVKAESANVFLQPTKELAEGRKEEATNANVMKWESTDEDKGNDIDIAFDVLSKKDDTGLAGTVGRGIESTLQLRTEPTETSKSASTTLKQEHEAIKIGKLDLSLSLSGCLQNSEFKSSISKTGSLVHAPSSQLLPSSSLHTNSDGFTALISLTKSQTVGHNPSCSLTQRSIDSYEHSVGSEPLFTGVDQMGNSAVLQGQLSSESTQKGGTAALLRTAWQNCHVPDNTLVGVTGNSNGMSKDLRRLASIPGVLSPTHSRGSQDPGLEHSRFRRQLTRERSSISLTKGERQEGEQVIINGSGVVERVISKVVSEPFHHTARMLQEMTENSIRYLREAISEIMIDPEKRGQIIPLQEALKKRSDLNIDMLRTCPQLLLEILVTIKTGLPYFIKKNSSVSSSDLVDVFLNLKCCNVSCRSVLPVDDCDCKICQRKTGFCSSCMCIVCSKFDSASNTCSWVGCDVCLHWCHTDCALRHSLIRKGQNSSRLYDTTEMQFHCAACGHPSEMYGFVKEVFRTCVRQWKIYTLTRELGYAERIFSYSDDARGKRVWHFVKQMLIKLENKAYYPEVVKCIITFFSDDDANLGAGPSEPLRGIPCSIAEGADGIPSSSHTAVWKPYTLEGLPVLEKGTVRSITRSPSLHKKSGEAELHGDDKKPVIDELDSLIRLKQAEAYMYQERANDARSRADELRHIVMAKTARIEEDYATRIAELNIIELQERRKQKIEELQVFERTHRQFFNMKTRMEASIRELLLKLEELKQN